MTGNDGLDHGPNGADWDENYSHARPRCLCGWRGEWLVVGFKWIEYFYDEYNVHADAVGVDHATI